MGFGMTAFSLRAASSPCVRRVSWTLRRNGAIALGHNFALRDVRRERRERILVVNAADKNDDASLSKSEYIEAVIEHVTQKAECGIVDFRLKDGKDSILPMFIGDYETAALLNFITKKEMSRPMTHELMKNTVKLLGYEVTQIHVTALVGFTYHARVFYRSASGEEVSIDSRPSDAVNLAVRFNAPIYVHRDVARAMATSRVAAKARSEVDVAKICREEIALHNDPTVELKLRMQMAIAQEQYATAAKLRDQIDHLLSSDRVLGLVVAMESALSGHRYEEALQIRDELRNLRLKHEGSEKQESL